MTVMRVFEQVPLRRKAQAVPKRDTSGVVVVGSATVASAAGQRQLGVDSGIVCVAAFMVALPSRCCRATEQAPCQERWMVESPLVTVGFDDCALLFGHERTAALVCHNGSPTVHFREKQRAFGKCAKMV
jgi:hypothetical protein